MSLASKLLLSSLFVTSSDGICGTLWDGVGIYNITTWSAHRVENKINQLIFCFVESMRAREKIRVNVLRDGTQEAPLRREKAHTHGWQWNMAFQVPCVFFFPDSIGRNHQVICKS